ncbi:Na+/H+ antiporter NhaA, partial [Herpetosiphon giganteus]|uniref:Na+/H+ antiporter NhaA n=1 Tax=Herpetosiphon giganteus TaxID=2029754 RepID=UPI00195A981C
MASPPTNSRPASHWSDTPLARVLTPMQEFMHYAQAGGIALIAVTIIALLLANTGMHQQYEAILATYAGINLGLFEVKLSIHHWINDGLMAIFFLFIGLEIKREVLVGELARLRGWYNESGAKLTRARWTILGNATDQGKDHHDSQ